MSMSTCPPSALLAGPVALRALARAFEQFDDFDRFLGGLQAALNRTPSFERALIALDRTMAEGAERFPTGTLSLPLLAGVDQLGTLQVGTPNERRQFGAEDLHLMAGLADFLGAVLMQAQRLQDAARSRELLRLLLNQAPVGIAAFGADRRPIVANEPAMRWLGAASLPFDEIEAGAHAFHLRAGGKLVYGEVRRVQDVPGGAWIVVLHDLTPEQGRLLEGMERDVFRARAEKSDCAVALIESIDLRNGTLRRLPALRAVLQEREHAGPYDANRIGVVLPRSGLALRARLRQLRPVFDGLPELRLGVAELGRDAADSTGLLHAALSRSGGYDALLKPAILLHDGNPGVLATLAMLLGREFKVVTASTAEQARDALAGDCFEGFLTEADARCGPSGAEMIRVARTLQPGIRAFLTSMQPAGEQLADPDVAVIGKPFDVAALTALVRDRLAN